MMRTLSTFPTFAAFLLWWQQQDATQLASLNRRRVSEYWQLHRVIEEKHKALESRAGVTITKQQAAEALDVMLKEEGRQNLAAYHKRHLKSPKAAAAAAGDAGAGNGRE